MVHLAIRLVALNVFITVFDGCDEKYYDEG